MSNAVALNAGIPADWEMQYLLAKGDEGAGAVLQSYNSSLWDVKKMLKVTRTVGVGIVEDNSRFPSLEAADMLAYEIRKQTGKHVGTNENRTVRRLFQALEANRTLHSWRFLNTEYALQLAIDTIQRSGRGDDDVGNLWAPTS